MSKKILCLVICLCMLFTLTACSGIGEEQGEITDIEKSATQTTENTTYLNEYLGFSFTVPSGWWIYSINSENFSTAAGATADAMNMDFSESEMYSIATFISTANMQYSYKNNHISFHLSAEKVTDIDDISLYMEQEYIPFMIEPYDGDPYILESQEQVTINDIAFEQVLFTVQQESREYKSLCLVTEVQNGYFLSFEISYWPENSDATNYVYSIVEDYFALL